MITSITQHNVATVHGPHFLQWIGHLKGTPASGMELGTLLGESAEWMLKNIFTHPDSSYLCVDTFGGSVEHGGTESDWAELEASTRAKLSAYPQAVVCKNRSADWMKICPEGLDFIFIDAAHDSLNVLRDSVLAFDLLKVGGTLCWDDYGWNVMPDPLDCPKVAIDSFLNIYSRQIEVLGKGWLVAAKKIHDA